MANNIYDHILMRKFCIHCFGFELLKLAFRENVTYKVSGEGFIKPVVNKDKVLPQIYYYEQVSYFPLCSKHKNELQIDISTKHRFESWFVTSTPQKSFSRDLLRSLAHILNTTNYPFGTRTERIKSLIEKQHNVLFLGGIMGRFWCSFAFLDLTSSDEDVILCVAKKNVLFNLQTLSAVKVAECLRQSQDADLLLSEGKIPAACYDQIRKYL